MTLAMVIQISLSIDLSLVEGIKAGKLLFRKSRCTKLVLYSAVNILTWIQLAEWEPTAIHSAIFILWFNTASLPLL